MAIKITDECINCDVCEPECPNGAISEAVHRRLLADLLLLFEVGQPHRLLLAQQHLANGADQLLQPGAGHGAGAKNTIVTALPFKLP